MSISVPFEEHEDSPSESGDRSGKFSFKRIFLTAWEDRFTFLQQLYTGGLLGLPMAYSTVWSGLFADQFQVERLVNRPVGSGAMTNPVTQQLTHDTKAKITITYSPLSPEAASESESSEPMRDGTWATYSQSQSVEYLNLPSRDMIWEQTDDVLPADITATVPILTTRHEITWHQVLNPPWSTISELKGKVNSAAFRIPATLQVAAAETLLFSESSAQIVFNFDQQAAWQLTFVFIEKAQNAFTNTSRGAIDSDGTVYGWNHQWNPSLGDYDRPLSRQGSKPMFQSADLFQLFI